MTAFLRRLRTQASVAIVGGSDIAKQKEQLGENSACLLKHNRCAADDIRQRFSDVLKDSCAWGASVVRELDFVFSENGMVSWDHGVELPSEVRSWIQIGMIPVDRL